jgi:hypothetical protein
MKIELPPLVKNILRRFGFSSYSLLGLNKKCTPEKYSPACKSMQIALILHYQSLVKKKKGLPYLNDTGFRIFSQNDEDGILLFIFSVICTKNKMFIEIGTGDGIECNCANLAINLGWHGIFIDGNEKALDVGKKIYGIHPDTRIFPPLFKAALVNRENINKIISDAGFKGEVDFLSIDIDGMDYWIWEAINCVDPRLVAVEINGKFGTRSIAVPYDPNWLYDSEKYPHYHGASLTAFNKLANQKGYRLIGTNRFGFNAFFLRNDICPDILPKVSAESCRTHFVRNRDEDYFAPISHLEYVEI